VRQPEDVRLGFHAVRRLRAPLRGIAEVERPGRARPQRPARGVGRRAGDPRRRPLRAWLRAASWRRGMTSRRGLGSSIPPE
jgi:hypothetical protein